MSFRCWIYYLPLALLINALTLYGMEYSGFFASEFQKQKELELSVRLWDEAPPWLTAAPKVSKSKKTRAFMQNPIQNPITAPDASQKIQSSKQKRPKALLLPFTLDESDFSKEQKSTLLKKESPGRELGKDSSNVKHEAAYIKQIAPLYPRRAWELGQEGMVVLRVLVNTDGFVDRINVYRSSKFKLLDQAAIAAVKGWEFKSRREGGKSAATWVKVPVRFLLEE